MLIAHSVQKTELSWPQDLQAERNSLVTKTNKLPVSFKKNYESNVSWSKLPCRYLTTVPVIVLFTSPGTVSGNLDIAFILT